MRYREIRPQPLLNRVVECFWTLENDETSEPCKPERILPDGCIELIINFGAPFVQHCDHGRSLQPRNFVVGQMTGPIVISPTGVTQLLGIRFHPGGTLPFLRIPLYEIRDEIVELGSLSSKLERDLLSRTSESLLFSEKIAAVETVLTNYFIAARYDPRLMILAAKIVNSCGTVSVDQLGDDAGVSSRQLERRFLREIGIGPKLLSRIIRFQQVFRAVEQWDTAWADVAVECGYYDQAHLIRDFNQFARQTPVVLFSTQSSLTESFTRKARKSDFSNTSYCDIQ